MRCFVCFLALSVGWVPAHGSSWPSDPASPHAETVHGDSFEPHYLPALVADARSTSGLAPFAIDPTLMRHAADRAEYLAAEFPGLYARRVRELLDQGMAPRSAARQAAYIAGHLENECGADYVFAPTSDCRNVGYADRMQAWGYAGGENVAFPASVIEGHWQLQDSSGHRNLRMDPRHTSYGWAVRNAGPYLIVIELIGSRRD